MSEPTRCQIAVAEFERRMRLDLFSHNPEALDETIANHYASLATMAMQMSQAIRLKRQAVGHQFDTSATDDMIQHCRSEIVRMHTASFGVPPSWETLRQHLTKRPT